MRAKNVSQDASASHILLIHKDRAGLAARRTVLQEVGYKVTAVTNGQAGLEEFSKNSFDLVITDYRMPQMNGDEVITTLRSIHPHIKIILISGVVDALGLTEDNTGADIVIPKSNLEVTQMTRAVQRLLSRKGPKPANPSPLVRRRNAV